MSKLLIFGIDPLPKDGSFYLSGPSGRTWQFVKPALDRKHSITLVCLDSNSSPPGISRRDLSQQFATEFIVYNAGYDDFTSLEQIERLASSFSPDAVIGTASILPNYIASGFADRFPFWADLFGSPIAEIHSRAQVFDDEQADVDLFHVWKMKKRILRSADKLSSVSNRQRCSLIGQLGIDGRLNRFSAGYEFIHVMPCAFEVPDHTPRSQQDSQTLAPPIVRGVKTAQNDFLIYWCGSYNTWMDVETLFNGVETAIVKNPRIKYVSSSGGIPGYNEKSYKDFCALVEGSELKDNFILLGWVDAGVIPKLYDECNLGINIDRFSYEGALGSRNRIIHFLKGGLPCLTTDITELTEELSRHDYIHTFEIGNPNDLAEKLLTLADNNDLLDRNIAAAQQYVLSQFSFENTTRDFLKFAGNPEFSPDKREKLKRAPENLFENVYLNEVEKYSHFEYVTKIEKEEEENGASFLGRLKKRLS